MNFLHSGGCGDIMYSLVAVKKLGGGTLYIKRKNKYNDLIDNYEALKDLLLHQPYIDDVIEYKETDFFNYDNNIKIDYDLDIFRLDQEIGQKHLVLCYLDMLKIDFAGWQEPWLIAPSADEELTLFNITKRYRTDFDWQGLIKNRKHGHFIGLESEHDEFSYLEHKKTSNLLDVAALINSSNHLYCNQSVALTIAQGLGKDYSLEVFHPQKNAIMRTKAETILNA